MIKQAPVRTYKTRPMSPETRRKVECSYAESVSLRERELRCPHCNHYIASLYSDISGHFKAKCSNCKTVTVYNLGYFRRKRLSPSKNPSKKKENKDKKSILIKEQSFSKNWIAIHKIHNRASGVRALCPGLSSAVWGRWHRIVLYAAAFIGAFCLLWFCFIRR